MSCHHKNVRQAYKCQASIQMSGKHPTTRQKSNVRQSPDMPQCLKICHTAPKICHNASKMCHFGTNSFYLSFSSQNWTKRALGALGGPISFYFPLFFSLFPPVGAPIFPSIAAVLCPLFALPLGVLDSWRSVKGSAGARTCKVTEEGFNEFLQGGSSMQPV